MSDDHMSDDHYNELLGSVLVGNDLPGLVGDLCEFPFDHLPGGNECDDDDDWFGDDVEHRS
jgi:hypothetical protein